MKRLVILALALAAASTMAQQQPADPWVSNGRAEVFDGPPLQLYEAAVKAIEERGWKIKTANPDARVIGFHTPGRQWLAPEAAVRIEPAANGRFVVGTWFKSHANSPAARKLSEDFFIAFGRQLRPLLVSGTAATH